MYPLVISLHVVTMLVALAYVAYWLPGLKGLSWPGKTLLVFSLTSGYALLLWWWS